MKKPLITFFLFSIFHFYSVEAQTVVELLRSGSNGSKRNLVIIGDGFQAGEQNAYNNFVNTFVMQGVFGEGVFRETMNAFNIYRINVNSVDSGVTQVDPFGNVTTARNTALDYRFSGDWNRCWMEPGPNTNINMNNILNALVPQRDYVFIILNEVGFGGCRRGNSLAVTNSVRWPVGSHEMGHMVGNLGDEYNQENQNYTSGEPIRVNLTINTDRDTLKWLDFVSPTTPIPTTCANVADRSQDAGLFEGGGASYSTGIYRPTCNDRMNTNRPSFGPVGYKAIHELLDTFHDYTYDNSYVGDFNGDGRDDLVLHNANTLALYVSTVFELEVEWIATGGIPLWSDFKPGDKFYVGDFNGDGMDDLFVVNYSDWIIPYFAMLRSTGSGFVCIRRFDGELPGWDSMKPNDEFLVADFDGDDQDDLYVFNGKDWSVGYLAMLRSTGMNLAYAKRYDDMLPGWDSLKQNDQIYVADFDGDDKDDLYIFNGKDWSIGYLGLLRSTGTGLTYVKRYDGGLPGWNELNPNDQIYVADFNKDDHDDLYLINGEDWSIGYLAMFRSTGTSLNYIRRYDGDVPGWNILGPNDKFFIADINGDDQDDLYVYNANDWATEYLGVLQVSETGLTGSWQANWIDIWDLNSDNNFLVADFNGDYSEDLFIRNSDWFGLLRSYQSSLGLNAIYPKWLHNHNYHRLGWW